MKRLVALTFSFAAAAALAQAAPSNAKPDAGFFRPTDLAAPPVPLVVTDPAPPPASVQQPGILPQPATQDPAVEIRKAEEVRKAETQMDRLERENERARMQAPTPITGAFTGLTDERNR